MAGLDPGQFGIRRRADIGVFLLVGGVAGIVDAWIDYAPHGDPFTLGTLFGVAAVGAKKLVLDPILERLWPNLADKDRKDHSA